MSNNKKIKSVSTLAALLVFCMACDKTVSSGTNPEALLNASADEIKAWDLSVVLANAQTFADSFSKSPNYVVKNDPNLAQKFPALLPLVSDLPGTNDLAAALTTSLKALKALSASNGSSIDILYQRGELNNLLSEARMIETYRVLFSVGQTLSDKIASVETDLNTKITGLNTSFSAQLVVQAAQITSLNNSVTSIETLLAQNQKDALDAIAATEARLVAQLAAKLDKTDPVYLAGLAQIASNTQSLIDLTSSVKSLREDLAQNYATVDEVNVLRDRILALEGQNAGTADQLKTIMQRLVLVETLAAQTQSMAVANAAQIDLMGQNFEKFKTDTFNKFALNDAQMLTVNNQLQSIRNDMQTQFNTLQSYARDAVAALDKKTQDQFVQVSMDIVDLKQKQANVATYITNVVQLVIGKDSNTQMNFSTADSVNALSDFVQNMNSLELEFIAALNPRGGQVNQFDALFRTDVMPTCGGNPSGDFGNAEGMDSFQFLAQEYVRELVFTPNPDVVYATDPATQAQVAAIFYGKPGVLPKNGLYNLLLAGATRMTIGNANQQCLNTIQIWARRVLNGNTDAGRQVRAALLASQQFKAAVDGIYTQLAALEPKVNTLEGLITNQITLVTGSAAALNIQLSADQGTLIVNIATSILDAVNNDFYLKDRQDMYDRIVSATKGLAADDATELARITNLETQMAAITANVANQEQRIGTLTGAMGKALSLIASLAARQGYTDLEAIAIATGTDLNVTVATIPDYAPVISDIEHFFSTSTSTTDLCSPNHIGAGAGVQTYYQHGAWNNCWVNFRTFPVTDAGTLANFRMRLFAKGNAFQVDVLDPAQTRPALAQGKKPADYCSSIPPLAGKSVTYFTAGDAHLQVKQGDERAGVFDLLPTAVVTNALLEAGNEQGVNTWFGVTFKVTPERRIDGAVITGAPVCYNIQLYSPLVLDFAKVGRTRLISSAESGVKFDLDADGFAEQTGWFNGKQSALLVFDSDGKGIVNGKNLFGQATYIPSLKRNARDGFEALAQFDANHDGRIDANDAIYGKLNLWFDRNGNGKVDPGELQSLGAAGVTSISLKSRDVSQEIGFDQGNLVKSEAPFESAVCGINCKVYDVFFGTGALRQLTKR